MGMSWGILQIEFRRSVALLLSPLILAAAWFASWYGMYATMPRNIYLWTETSRVVKDSILTIGPLVAGLSAWAAGRNRRRGMGDLLSTTARPAASRDLLTWAGVALPCVAVYAGLIVLLGVPTALNATWGMPLPGYLLVGLVALLMDSALGFAAGYYLPGRFTAPLVAVGLYVGHLLPMGLEDLGVNFTLLSPAAYSNTGTGGVFYEMPRLAAQQSLLFGGLCGAALAGVALGECGARGKARVALAACLTAAVVGLVIALRTEDLYTSLDESEVVSFEPVCKEGGITVCIHPAYASVLPENAEAANEIAAPLVGIPGVPTRALQANGPKTMPDGVDTEDTAFFSNYATGEDDEFMIKGDLAYDLTGSETMRSGPQADAEEAKPTEEDLRRCGGLQNTKHFDPAYEAQTVVGDWLLQRAGVPGLPMSLCPNSKQLVKRFAALDTAEREAWLEKNFADLRAGKITLEDLP